MGCGERRGTTKEKKEKEGTDEKNGEEYRGDELKHLNREPWTRGLGERK